MRVLVATVQADRTDALQTPNTVRPTVGFLGRLAMTIWVVTLGVSLEHTVGCPALVGRLASTMA